MLGAQRTSVDMFIVSKESRWHVGLEESLRYSIGILYTVNSISLAYSVFNNIDHLGDILDVQI
jgi:hypothetical protein